MRQADLGTGVEKETTTIGRSKERAKARSTKGKEARSRRAVGEGRQGSERQREGLIKVGNEE